MSKLPVQENIETQCHLTINQSKDHNVTQKTKNKNITRDPIPV